MYNFFGYLGAAMMVLSPPIINTTEGKFLAMAGLVCLTVQAIEKKMYNLIALNILSIGGYFYAIYF